ncbi:MAG: hypothetical protein KDB22_25240 [Planctomycetales bacterium]|nr:hypothetical protein [Planctomycetales bacterium]
MIKADTRAIAFAFFIGAMLLRFVPHPPNFTPVAAMALFAGCYLSGVTGMVFALGAMAFSDFVGNSLGIPGIHFYGPGTTLTVYIALAMSALVGCTLRGRTNAFTVPAASLLGTGIFFITTNFASWLDPMMGYPQTLAGLISCYLAAIPFAGNTLAGDLFFSALLFGSYAWLTRPQSQSLVYAEAKVSA